MTESYNYIRIRLNYITTAQVLFETTTARLVADIYNRMSRRIFTQNSGLASFTFDDTCASELAPATEAKRNDCNGT